MSGPAGQGLSTPFKRTSCASQYQFQVWGRGSLVSIGRVHCSDWW
jgi:hypothetical protein